MPDPIKDRQYSLGFVRRPLANADLAKVSVIEAPTIRCNPSDESAVDTAQGGRPEKLTVVLRCNRRMSEPEHRVRRTYEPFLLHDANCALPQSHGVVSEVAGKNAQELLLACFVRHSSLEGLAPNNFAVDCHR